MQLTDATVGMMVQSAERNDMAFPSIKFIGTVKGVTVNALGEAILLIDTVQRRPAWVKDEFDMVREGMVLAAAGSEFVHVTRPVHPSIVEPMTSITHLMEKE